MGAIGGWGGRGPSVFFGTVLVLWLGACDATSEPRAGSSAAGTGGDSQGAGSSGTRSAGSGGSGAAGSTAGGAGGERTGGAGGGSAAGSSSAGAGGTGGGGDAACEQASDCGFGEIDHEILSEADCPCLLGCPYLALSKATIERRGSQYAAICNPRTDGEGNSCGIDDCIPPPVPACEGHVCMAAVGAQAQ